MDAKGMLSENVYDGLGQLTKVRTGGKGAAAGGLYSFAGEVWETDYAYDSLGRNTKVMDEEEGVSSVVFDGLGRITSLKDPNRNRAGDKGANTYEYTYNEKGLVEKEKNAIGNVTEYLYNDSMLLSQIKDSAGEKTTYRYDGLNRIKAVSDGIGTITYTYDANGNITDVTEKSGVLENLFGSGETIHRDFHSLNRVTKYVDCNGHEVKYGYDELGNMKTLAYPGGETVSYTYHDDGNVKTMESSSGGTFIYGYDNYGRLCKITRADASTEERKYDAAGQLISQTDKDKNGNILQQSTYEYDVFGEMTTKST